MSKLKVLHVIPSLAKGGAERLAIDICNYLSKDKDTEVKLLTFRDTNAYQYLADDLPWSVVPASVTPSISGKWKVEIGKYLDFVSEFAPDIIHSHLFEAEMVTRHQIEPETTYVSHLHDNMVQFQKFKASSLTSKVAITNSYERRHITKQYHECNNHFIAISEDVRSYFTQNIPDMAGNIKLMHNAIDLERFQTGADKAAPIEGQAIRLVNIGAFVEKKNQAFLLEVVNHLNNQGFDVSLDLLGDGPLRQHVRDKVRELSLEKMIRLPGNVDGVESYLQEANIYVHSATYEPFGLVLLEAMACGLPCITLDGKGNRDIIQDGVNGFIMADNSSIRYAEKIVELARTPELYNEISSKGLRTSKEFDIKHYVKKLIAYYRDLLVNSAHL